MLSENLVQQAFSSLAVYSLVLMKIYVFLIEIPFQVKVNYTRLYPKQFLGRYNMEPHLDDIRYPRVITYRKMWGTTENPAFAEEWLFQGFVGSLWV